MKSSTVIVDYGVGNLRSVARAFEFCGAEATISSDPKTITLADRIVLPGVGAFGDCMSGLQTRGLRHPLMEFVDTDRPFLGICVGMQILHEIGEEFGQHEGLGIIAGRVSPIPREGTDGCLHKVPFIGWSGIFLPENEGKSWENTILANTKKGANVYFVHSFGAKPTNPENILAVYYYNGQPITAAVRSHNVYGCQFHPEKSGQVGLQIIKDFLKL
ncbi:MAG: imidazole glycerol phosphate synthase subunit HisH [Proteobacteria bacterium]|nr:imidazole glycerol phosphate synthase subunit HisH [Pseudomonadota bacterium]MBU2620670.1 imidazole glycerol phosphate synthase subunit HisH [Pseudomonadota bacterium]